MLYRVPYDHDWQTWQHNVVPSTIWSGLSNFITQCCTEYHMITIVKLYHTMLYRVPYDHDCQILPHNVVPSNLGTTLCGQVWQSLSYDTRYNIEWSSLTIVITWYSVQHYVVKFDNRDTTQCCTEYHMITIVKLDHTMLYRVPYDHLCQTWPHNVVPSTIWSRLSNFITQCCTEYHMITIV
jgi:hypothetical protein